MIDPNIWTSEDVSKLNMMERLLLIGMFSNADDFGKGKANPVYLRSTIFPYDDIPVAEIQTALDHVCSYASIVLYEVNNSKYYKFLNWDKWQRVDHPQDSPIPEPFQNESRIIPESFQTNIIQDNIKEDKSKENIRQDKGVDECSCSSPDLSDEDLKTVAAEFEQCGYGTINGTIAEMLISLINEYTVEWVIMALKEGVAQGKRKLSYVKGILKNWQADGGPQTEPKNRGKPKNKVQTALDLVEKIKREEEEEGIT
jgi:DnaD/phage-associated family protein